MPNDAGLRVGVIGSADALAEHPQLSLVIARQSFGFPSLAARFC